jgi:small subunit ribosomal protein S17
MANSLTGLVTSAAPNKTIVVTVSERKTHPLYRKQYTSTKKFLAHDEENKAAVGDSVLIIETRPISARKHYRLDKILKTAPIRHVETPEEAEKAK